MRKSLNLIELYACQTRYSSKSFADRLAIAPTKADGDEIAAIEFGFIAHNKRQNSITVKRHKFDHHPPFYFTQITANSCALHNNW